MFRKASAISTFLLTLLAATQLSATQLHIVVLDSTGAPLPDQLVIVKSLDTPKEIFRAMSDSMGNVPDHDVALGLYRVISTHPHGWWKTEVAEFLVGKTPASIELRVQPMSPQGYGDVVWVGPRRPELKLRFSDTAGNPAAMVSFLVRDSEAQHWFWSKSNDRGEATFRSDDWQLLDPRDGIAIVAIWKNRLVKTILTEEAMAAAHKSGKPIVVQLNSETSP
jgi:hypothetical protein